MPDSCATEKTLDAFETMFGPGEYVILDRRIKFGENTTN
jgi:hypothetical protein